MDTKAINTASMAFEKSNAHRQRDLANLRSTQGLNQSFRTTPLSEQIPTSADYLEPAPPRKHARLFGSMGNTNTLPQ